MLNTDYPGRDMVAYARNHVLHCYGNKESKKMATPSGSNSCNSCSSQDVSTSFDTKIIIDSVIKNNCKSIRSGEMFFAPHYKDFNEKKKIVSL